MSRANGRIVQEVVPTKVASEAYYNYNEEASWPSVVAAAGRSKLNDDGLDPRYRWWLSDTGCGRDLAGRKTMSREMAATEWRAEEPIVFETPNGDVAADKMVCAQIKVLGENVEAYLLDDSPDVLSIGRRCQEYGYGFHWNPFSGKPFFASPNGDKIECYTLDYVPYIPDRWNAENAPVLKYSGQAVCRKATISNAPANDEYSQ